MEMFMEGIVIVGEVPISTGRKDDKLPASILKIVRATIKLKENIDISHSVHVSISYCTLSSVKLFMLCLLYRNVIC